MKVRSNVYVDMICIVIWTKNVGLVVSQQKRDPMFDPIFV